MPKPSPDARTTLIGCPSCAGVLSVVREHDSRHIQFICSIGHTFSPQAVLEQKETQIEAGLWSLISMFEHVEMITEFLLKQSDDGVLPVSREGLNARRDQVIHQAKVVRGLIEETNTPDLDVAG